MAKKPQSADIHPGPGFRVRKNITRPDKALVDAYREFESPDISDMTNRLYTMVPAIRHQCGPVPLVGPACTVKAYPGDNLLVHKALDVAQPGDIIVVDTGSCTTHAVLGDLISNKARHLGIAGFIIDGLARDLPGLVECGLPVFARGITPTGPLHRGPGELNYPIACGGVVVDPGDILCADTNGIVVIRSDFASETLERLRAQRDGLAAYVEGVKQGKFSNEWVDRTLEAANCRVEE